MFALVRPAAKFTVLVEGAGPPVAQTRRKPASPGFTTVGISTTARASAGTPHEPATAKVRRLPAGRGACAVRVSATRQGGGGSSPWASRSTARPTAPSRSPRRPRRGRAGRPPPPAARDRSGGAGADIAHGGGAGGRPVALPQLGALEAVAGAEVQRARLEGQARWEGAHRAGVDVPHPHGARRGAVALPKLGAAGAVVGGEVDSVPPDARRFAGAEPADPGRMSLTSTVPASVPSLFHSSYPCTPSLAVKNSVPFTLVRPDRVGAGVAGTDVLHQHRAGGRAVALPQLGSAGPRDAPGRTACRPRRSAPSPPAAGPPRQSLVRRSVPASVPSLFHRSPLVGRRRRRRTASRFTSVSSDRKVALGPGTMSLTRTVPASVPSLFHSS